MVALNSHIDSSLQSSLYQYVISRIKHFGRTPTVQIVHRYKLKYKSVNFSKTANQHVFQNFSSKMRHLYSKIHPLPPPPLRKKQKNRKLVFIWTNTYIYKMVLERIFEKSTVTLYVVTHFNVKKFTKKYTNFFSFDADFEFPVFFFFFQIHFLLLIWEKTNFVEHVLDISPKKEYFSTST